MAEIPSKEKTIAQLKELAEIFVQSEKYQRASHDDTLLSEDEQDLLVRLAHNLNRFGKDMLITARIQGFETPSGTFDHEGKNGLLMLGEWMNSEDKSGNLDKFLGPSAMRVAIDEAHKAIKDNFDSSIIKFQIQMDEWDSMPEDDLGIIDDINAFNKSFLNISSGESGRGSPEEYDANQYQKVQVLLEHINLELAEVEGLNTFEAWGNDPVAHKKDIEAFFKKEGTRELFSERRDQLKAESKALASTRKQENTGNKPPPLSEKGKTDHITDRVKKMQGEEKKATASTAKPAQKPDNFKKFSASDMVKDLQTQMKQKITDMKEAVKNFRHGPGK